MKARWFGSLSIVAVLRIAALPAICAAPGAKDSLIFTGEDIDLRLRSRGERRALAKVQTIAQHTYIPSINMKTPGAWGKEVAYNRSILIESK